MKTTEPNQGLRRHKLLTGAKTIDEALSVALRRLKRSVPEAEVYAAHVTGEERKWRVELSVARFSIPHVYDVAKAIEAQRAFCERCGEELQPERARWLEMNMNTGECQDPGAVDWGEASQGCFAFGQACARQVLKKGFHRKGYFSIPRVYDVAKAIEAQRA